MARKKAPADATALASLRFGEARDRLEAILENLERGEVDIDELADRVKEAATLIRVLHDKLTRTKADVEKVLEEVREEEGAEGAGAGVDDDDE